MKALLVLIAFATSAHAEAWKVKQSPNEMLSIPVKYCDLPIQTWLVSIAAQHPTIETKRSFMLLQIDKTTTFSDRAIITDDYAIGFWDAPPWSDRNATLIVRLHPKTSTIEILLIQRKSATDRGDACYLEWRGESERIP